jgi:hypothetical protein
MPATRPPVLVALVRTLFACLLGLSLACGEEPSAPADPAGSPRDGIPEGAIELRIDVPTGAVRIAPPAPALTARASGPAYSLVGNEIVGLQTSDCTFVPQSKRKTRCLFSLALVNRSPAIDLVTATSFPRPPAGAFGILVFPLTAGALGVPGGSATASPEWDVAPSNFFNDFSGCTISTTSDCYRSELYPSPLQAGQTTAPRIVGFDVDKGAQSVSVYVVVAADLRDHYQLTTTSLLPAGDRSGTVGGEGSVTSGYLAGDGRTNVGNRMFFGFDLSSLPSDAIIVSARLQAADVGGGSGDPYSTMGDLLLDHVDVGASLDATDFAASALSSHIAILSQVRAGAKDAEVTAAVAADVAAGRSTSDFRAGFRDLTDGDSEIDTAVFLDDTFSPGLGPRLVVVYRRP